VTRATLLNSMIVGQPEANIVSRTTVGHGNSSERNSVLARLTQRGKLERVARGVYRIASLIFLQIACRNTGKPFYGRERARAPNRSRSLTKLPWKCTGSPTRIRREFILTVPKDARLRRRKPKWIVIHRGHLPSSDVTTPEGLPVTTVAKSVLDVNGGNGKAGSGPSSYQGPAQRRLY